MAVYLPDAHGRLILWKEEGSGAMDGASSLGEQEFQALYERTARSLLAYLIGVAGRRDVAEDLLQETYCRFLTRDPKTLDADETRRYLFRIATNLLRDRWRRGGEAQFPENYDEGACGNVDLQLDVRKVMKALKPRERELLWLAYVEGMSHREIAEATGLNGMSIRMLLFRARKKAATLLRPGKGSR